MAIKVAPFTFEGKRYEVYPEGGAGFLVCLAHKGVRKPGEFEIVPCPRSNGFRQRAVSLYNESLKAGSPTEVEALARKEAKLREEFKIFLDDGSFVSTT